MSTTRFLTNDGLWKEIDARVKAARRVRAAVAYLGRGGAGYLPLRRGDKLVVDMSIGAVRQGVTDPREIRKLIKKGVEVFSRATLHAKFYVVDDALIAGSANVSKNSRSKLDESAILTTDAMSVRRATAFFDDKLATQPVREHYLRDCIKAYRPPKFKAAADGTETSPMKGRRAVEASLWFIGGLNYINPPEAEKRQIKSAEQRAKKELKRAEGTSLSWIRYVTRPKFMDDIRIGDWVVQCVQNEDKTREISAPEQVLSEENYRRADKKNVHLLMLESSDAAEVIPLSNFRLRIRRDVAILDKDKPRTRPIVDTAQADAILALWTPTGRVSKTRKRRK